MVALKEKWLDKKKNHKVQAVIYDGMVDRNTRRAHTGRSNGIGEPLDLWGGLLGQREVTFEHARSLFTIENMLILF